MSEGIAHISLREVFDSIQELKSEVRVLIQQNRIDHEARADHEARIRLLERWRYTIPTTILIATASIIITVLEKA